MTVRLSPHKVTSIMKGYFQGRRQVIVAKRAKVDQGTISHYASRFKKRAAEIGILAAAKEYNVFNEVDELRALSVELAKNGHTVSEAQEGFRIYKTFLKLGVSPKQHAVLVKVCKEIKEPGFIQAAAKLKQIEDDTGIPYQEAISRFEAATKELPAIEKELKAKKAELQAVSQSLAQKKHDMAGLEEQLEQLKEKSETEAKKLEQQLHLKMKELNVKDEEVKQVANLKAELIKIGLDIPALMKVAKEFMHGNDED